MALKDHAQEILTAIAIDIETHQSKEEQYLNEDLDCVLNRLLFLYAVPRNSYLKLNQRPQCRLTK